MSYIFTYDNLVTQVQNYLERTDVSLVDSIPVFVSLAQLRLGREIKHLGVKSVLTGNFSGDTLSSGVLQKPGRWRETVSFNFGTGTSNNTRNILQPRSYEFCRNYWPDPTQTGTPKFYADYSFTHWLITPTPSDGYPFEVTLYETPLPIDTTTQTNWYTQYAPDLLLYATLLEATPYLKIDERLQMWQERYDRGMMAVNGEAQARTNDASVNREEGI